MILTYLFCSAIGAQRRRSPNAMATEIFEQHLGSHILQVCEECLPSYFLHVHNFIPFFIFWQSQLFLVNSKSFLCSFPFYIWRLSLQGEEKCLITQKTHFPLKYCTNKTVFHQLTLGTLYVIDVYLKVTKYCPLHKSV